MHDQMTKALRDIVVPLLRKRAFTGSFPHFRRRGQERIDLLTFQFDRYGGGFIIEIAQCKPEGFTNYWGKQIPPEKVRAWDLTERVRLQPRNGSGTDSWFRFDAGANDIFVRTATSVIPFLEQAEHMFADFQRALKRG